MSQRKGQDPSRQMSEWLDIMLSEIARKHAEELAAKEEADRRAESVAVDKPAAAKPD